MTIPTQILHHLGFILNSLDMTVSISEDKYQKLKLVAQRILDSKSPTIREVAQLVGMMVSCFLGIEYGELFYWQLEIEKAKALKTNNWDFEQTMHLSKVASADIALWIRNALSSKKRINHGKIDHTLYTVLVETNLCAFAMVNVGCAVKLAQGQELLLTRIVSTRIVYHHMVVLQHQIYPPMLLHLHMACFLLLIAQVLLLVPKVGSGLKRTLLLPIHLKTKLWYTFPHWSQFITVL